MQLNVRLLKWTTLIFNLIMIFVGFAIIGVTLRLLFDSSVTVLFFPTGNYVVGHCLIAAGSIMAVFGILGLIGIMSENSCLIWTFFTMVLLSLVANIAAGALVYNHDDTFRQTVNNFIHKSVKSNYNILPNVTNRMDIIQEQWQCCGSNSYKDWSSSDYGRNQRSNPTNIDVSPTYKVPTSCCIRPRSDECRDSHESITIGQDVTHLLHQEGCNPKFDAAIGIYARNVYIGVPILAIIQIASLITTALLALAIRPRYTDPFASRQGLNSSHASAPMLSNAESGDLKKSYSVTSSQNASRSSLNLEPAVISSKGMQ